LNGISGSIHLLNPTQFQWQGIKRGPFGQWNELIGPLKPQMNGSRKIIQLRANRRSLDIVSYVRSAISGPHLVAVVITIAEVLPGICALSFIQ